MRVLIIDDSRTMRMIIGRALKQLGFEILEAVNGLDGMEKIRESGALDLLIVDWNMPEMNGLEFVIALRGDKSFDSLPIMMITTEMEVANVQKALAAGANEYIMKPFTTESIKEKIALLGIPA